MRKKSARPPPSCRPLRLILPVWQEETRAERVAGLRVMQAVVFKKLMAELGKIMELTGYQRDASPNHQSWHAANKTATRISLTAKERQATNTDPEAIEADIKLNKANLKVCTVAATDDILRAELSLVVQILREETRRLTEEQGGPSKSSASSSA
jgi:hypothetical protein